MIENVTSDPPQKSFILAGEADLGSGIWDSNMRVLRKFLASHGVKEPLLGLFADGKWKKK